jgi:WD40 repeat protein
LTPDEIMFLVSVNDGRTEFRRTVDGDLYWEIDVRYTTVSFSPGGEFFFGLLPNGTIEKRGTLDGALIDFLEGHPSRVLDIAFSPDGSILAGAFSDGWIRIFSTVNGQFLGVLTGQSHSLAFSPDGSLLGAGLTDGIIRIFQLEEGNFYDLSREHQAVVTDLAFSPDGSLLLSGSRDCTARLWDMSSRRAISTVNPGGDHPFRIFNVALVPQELRLFFTGNRNGVYSYQDDRPLSVFLESIYYPSDITADPNNNWMALTGPGTWLVDISQDGKPSQLTELDANPAANGYALAFSPAADLLVLSTIQDLEFWSVPEGVLLDHLNIDHQTQPNAWPEALAISPDGQLIALATHNGLIHIFGIPETSPD